MYQIDFLLLGAEIKFRKLFLAMLIIADIEQAGVPSEGRREQDFWSFK